MGSISEPFTSLAVLPRSRRMAHWRKLTELSTSQDGPVHCCAFLPARKLSRPGHPAPVCLPFCLQPLLSHLESSWPRCVAAFPQSQQGRPCLSFSVHEAFSDCFLTYGSPSTKLLQDAEVSDEESSSAFRKSRSPCRGTGDALKPGQGGGYRPVEGSES